MTSHRLDARATRPTCECASTTLCAARDSAHRAPKRRTPCARAAHRRWSPLLPRFLRNKRDMAGSA